MPTIGVLTGGSDAPGLNAAIRAIVLAAEQRDGVETAGVRNGFEGIAGSHWASLAATDVRGIHTRGGSILGCDNIFRGEPTAFEAALREGGLDGLIVIGGNGSLTVAQAMVEAGASVVGVPKTIDNDVAGTELTIGFDTAVRVVADACQRLIDTAESHRRVMILEVMGRHSGFIALHGAMAGGADIALLPEIGYKLDAIVASIEQRQTRGRNHTLIVAAEGAAERGGAPVIDRLRTDSTGIQHLGGIGQMLRESLRDRCDSEVRAVDLAYLQRGGPPTAFDRVEAAHMGVQALGAMTEGETGTFAAYAGGEIEMRPLTEAAGKARQVELEGSLVLSARGMGLQFGD